MIQIPILRHITDWLITRRAYVDQVRNAIAVYEYIKTEENLKRICIETHKLARFYNDLYYTKHEARLGYFLWELQHLEGVELTMSLYRYQLWLNDRVRSKYFIQLLCCIRKRLQGPKN